MKNEFFYIELFYILIKGVCYYHWDLCQLLAVCFPGIDKTRELSIQMLKPSLKNTV